MLNSRVRGEIVTSDAPERCVLCGQIGFELRIQSDNARQMVVIYNEEDNPRTIAGSALLCALFHREEAANRVATGLTLR